MSSFRACYCESVPALWMLMTALVLGFIYATRKYDIGTIHTLLSGGPACKRDLTYMDPPLPASHVHILVTGFRNVTEEL